MASVIPVQDPKLAGKSPRAIAVSLRRPASVHGGIGSAVGARAGPRTIYLSSGKLGLPLLVWGCALVNVIFWGNLADWTWRDYSVQVTASSTPTQLQRPAQQVHDAQSTQAGTAANGVEENIRYERASTRQRGAYAIGLAALGLGISTAFMLVSRRVVNRIDMMPDGSSVLLHTGFLRRSTASKASSAGSIVPLTDLSLKASLDLASSPGAGTVGNYTQLLRKKQIIGYLIDRRGHFLGGPKVLDELFMRSV